MLSLCCVVIADLQAKNRSLEEKNKLLEEKCEQFSKDGKQIQQHLSTMLKSYQALERRLSDVTAEKEAYINVSMTETIYCWSTQPNVISQTPYESIHHNVHYT